MRTPRHNARISTDFVSWAFAASVIGLLVLILALLIHPSAAAAAFCGWRRADLRPDCSKQQAAKQSVGWMMPPGAGWPQKFRAVAVGVGHIPVERRLSLFVGRDTDRVRIDFRPGGTGKCFFRTFLFAFKHAQNALTFLVQRLQESFLLF